MKNREKSKRSSKSKPIIIVVVLVIFGVGGIGAFKFWPQTSTKKEPQADVVLNQELSNSIAVKKGTVKIFSGQQFSELYNNFAYPNTEYIEQASNITGDQKIDTYIQNLAEKRGYKKRSAPVSDTFQTVSEGVTLQQRAVEPWKQMQKDASAAGVEMNLTAGYRSAEDQHKLLIEALAQAKINNVNIPTGMYDEKLDDILSNTAIPGYSRHHTGYTIDIGCKGDSDKNFQFSTCFTWLSTDNYKNAKKYGWIPSYPEGAGKQGPNPEAWEYVWVGTDALTE